MQIKLCYVFLTFGSFLSKYTFLRLQHFIPPRAYPINLSGTLYLIKFLFLIKHIFLLATVTMITEKLPFSYVHSNHG